MRWFVLVFMGVVARLGAQVIPLPADERMRDGEFVLKPGDFAAVPAEASELFLQTLAMLIEAAPKDNDGRIRIACRDIVDAPRFAFNPAKPETLAFLDDILAEVASLVPNAGYPVVLTPRRPCYFDFIQHESHKVGRVWGGFNPLRDVYQFPAPLKLSAADEAKVLGIQTCLWTEATVTQARRDFMTWPRLAALAEAAWTPEPRKDFSSFEHRLKPQLGWLKANGIGFYDPFTHSPEVTDQGAKTEYLDMPE